MRKRSSSTSLDKNRVGTKKTGPSRVFIISMIVLFLAVAGIVINFAEFFIRAAENFEASFGYPPSSIWGWLIPYYEIVKMIADLTLLPIALIVVGIVSAIVKRRVMKARVLETGIPVPAFIKAVEQYAVRGRKGSYRNETAFELEVRPPGTAPFHASVRESSEDVYETEYAVGTTIAALYDKKTQTVRVPEPDFDEAEHNRRARMLAKFPWIMFFIMLKKLLVNGTVLFIAILLSIIFGSFIANLGLSKFLAAIAFFLKWLSLFVGSLTAGLFIGIYAGLTTDERLETEESEEEKRHTPPPYKGVG